MKDKILIIGSIALVLLLVIPVPNIVVTSLFALLFLGLIAIAFVNFYSLRKRKLIQYLPSIIVYWSLAGLGITISSVRNILTTENFENQSNLIRALGNDIVGKNIYLGLPISIILIVITLLIVKVSQLRCKNTISSLQEKTSRNELEYLLSYDGANKFLSGTIKAVVLIFGVVIIGYSLVHFINYKQDIAVAMKESIALASGLTNTMLAMMTLCNFFCDFFIREFFKEDNK